MSSEEKSSNPLSSLRVAIVHEWLVDYSGSERVLAQVLNVFPEADLYAQVEFLPDDLRWFIRDKPVTTSFVQRLPGARSRYRSYLPLMPLAVEQFDLSEYDLIISNNHAVAKGVITGPDQLHISYVHSPMRYAWDMTHQYLRESGLGSGLKGRLVRLILHYLRGWDSRTANGVDHYICNSKFIARRIEKIYRRRARVINPPVDIAAFPLETTKDDYYVTASRMVPYKRIGLIVKAFSRMPDKRLVVIGDGPMFRKVKGEAAANVTFLGYQPTDALCRYIQKARAFIFAAEEDFGILPVEAQACGTPVIAYNRGGARETVIDGETGLFFDRQTPEAISEAVLRFENISSWNSQRIRNNALRFSEERFRMEFTDYVESLVRAHREKIGRDPDSESLTGSSQSEARSIRILRKAMETVY